MGAHSKLRRPLEGLKVLLVWGFAVALAFVATPSVASLVAGVPLVLAGLAIRAWAAGHLQRNKELATSGPYAYVRDPLYVGRLLLLCGMGVVGNNAWAYALAGASILIFFLDYMPRKLRKETARLEQHFGEPYVQYRREVRSLIPRLHPYSASSGKRWSAALFWRENREQWLMLAVLLLMAAMAYKGLH